MGPRRRWCSAEHEHRRLGRPRQCRHTLKMPRHRRRARHISDMNGFTAIAEPMCRMIATSCGTARATSSRWRGCSIYRSALVSKISGCRATRPRSRWRSLASGASTGLVRRAAAGRPRWVCWTFQTWSTSLDRLEAALDQEQGGSMTDTGITDEIEASPAAAELSALRRGPSTSTMRRLLRRAPERGGRRPDSSPIGSPMVAVVLDPDHRRDRTGHRSARSPLPRHVRPRRRPSSCRRASPTVTATTFLLVDPGSARTTACR